MSLRSSAGAWSRARGCVRGRPSRKPSSPITLPAPALPSTIMRPPRSSKASTSPSSTMIRLLEGAPLKKMTSPGSAITGTVTSSRSAAYSSSVRYAISSPARSAGHQVPAIGVSSDETAAMIARGLADAPRPSETVLVQPGEHARRAISASHVGGRAAASLRHLERVVAAFDAQSVRAPPSDASSVSSRSQPREGVARALHEQHRAPARRGGGGRAAVSGLPGRVQRVAEEHAARRRPRPCATACDAMRPPIDLPPCTTPPRAQRRAARTRPPPRVVASSTVRAGREGGGARRCRGSCRGPRGGRRPPGPPPGARGTACWRLPPAPWPEDHDRAALRRGRDASTESVRRPGSDLAPCRGEHTPRRPARMSSRRRVAQSAGRGRQSVYEAHYGFTEKPFNLTPDPKYLYLSAPPHRGLRPPRVRPPRAGRLHR